MILTGGERAQHTESEQGETSSGKDEWKSYIETFFRNLT